MGLVASTRTSSAPSSSRPHSSAAAPITCSQLSSTSSSCRRASALASERGQPFAAEDPGQIADGDVAAVRGNSQPQLQRLQAGQAASADRADHGAGQRAGPQPQDPERGAGERGQRQAAAAPDIQVLQAGISVQQGVMSHPQGQVTSSSSVVRTPNKIAFSSGSREAASASICTAALLVSNPGSSQQPRMRWVTAVAPALARKRSKSSPSCTVRTSQAAPAVGGAAEFPPNSFCVVPGVLANVAEGIPGVCLVIGFRNPMVQIERLLTVGQCLLNSPRRA
jgi:hypothetical protein